MQRGNNSNLDASHVNVGIGMWRVLRSAAGVVAGHMEPTVNICRQGSRPMSVKEGRDEALTSLGQKPQAKNGKGISV